MSTVTRHALRVYSALSGLKGSGDDVLDALIPFFEPILEVMNGKIFDPRLFAVGVQKLYRWRFTADIAEHFIPRLLRKDYLIRHAASAGKAVYTVKFSPQPPSTENLPVSELLKQIVDEFVKFPARISCRTNSPSIVRSSEKRAQKLRALKPNVMLQTRLS
jgi:hypothetical protein